MKWFLGEYLDTNLMGADKHLYICQSQYKCQALIAQMVRAFGMNPKVGGSSPPSGRDIFCLKNFDTFTRTPVRMSKMNAVARAQFTFQMLTLLPKHLMGADKHLYIYPDSLPIEALRHVSATMFIIGSDI